MIELTFTPQSRLTPLVYAVAGEVVTVNGAAFDFDPLDQGALLPAAAVGGDWLISDAIRTDGTVHLTAVAPVLPAGPWSPAPSVGSIDWTRMLTASARATATTAAWRAQAALPVTDFALAALAAGLIPEADAEAWVTGSAVPAVVASALATLPEAHRMAARLRIRGATIVRRASPEVALLAAHMGLGDAQVDALFGGPP